MHELSIANQLVTVTEEEARKLGATQVNKVILQLGELSGVVQEALEFAWEFVTEHTLLQGAELVIENVSVVARCNPCDLEFQPDDPRRLRCPQCGQPTPDLLHGRELTIRSIDYDSKPEEHDRAQAS